MRPSFAGSSDMTPQTSDKKIKGTTIILMALMNNVPIGLMTTMPGPTIRPTIRPRKRAARMRPQSGTRL